MTESTTDIPPVRVRDESAEIALFQRFLDGDDAAFMELFNRVTPRLYLYARKMLGDAVEAGDLIQDVWERMARYRIEGRQPPRSPVGLLIRTTRNLCLNQIRNRRRRRQESLDALPEWKRPAAASSDMTEHEEAVVLGLERLPIHQREVLVLHAYVGYSYEEIASMLGESAGSVRMRAWRARTSLARVVSALLNLRGDDELPPTDGDNDDNR